MSRMLIYHKISKIQQNLMGKSIEDYSLNTLIPLIFKEACKQNLMFYFNCIENAVVLNIRDTSEENMELNIRYHHNHADISPEILEMMELRLLQNTFLLVSKSHPFNHSNDADETSSKPDVHEKPITESNLVPPSAIRVAMEECKQQGEPITRKNLENKLNLKGMNQDKRRQCIAYLRDMEE